MGTAPAAPIATPQRRAPRPPAAPAAAPVVPVAAPTRRARIAAEAAPAAEAPTRSKLPPMDEATKKAFRAAQVRFKRAGDDAATANQKALAAIGAGVPAKTKRAPAAAPAHDDAAAPARRGRKVADPAPAEAPKRRRTAPPADTAESFGSGPLFVLTKLTGTKSSTVNGSSLDDVVAKAQAQKF